MKWEYFIWWVWDGSTKGDSVSPPVQMLLPPSRKEALPHAEVTSGLVYSHCSSSCRRAPLRSLAPSSTTPRRYFYSLMRSLLKSSLPRLTRPSSHSLSSHDMRIFAACQALASSILRPVASLPLGSPELSHLTRRGGSASPSPELKHHLRVHFRAFLFPSGSFSLIFGLRGPAGRPRSPLTPPALALCSLRGGGGARERGREAGSARPPPA